MAQLLYWDFKWGLRVCICGGGFRVRVSLWRRNLGFEFGV